MRSSAIIELIGYVYQDAKRPNAEKYPNWVVFKLCVNKKYKNKQGEVKEDTSWYECKTNSEGMAKICRQYVKNKMGLIVKGIPKVKAFIDSKNQPQASIEVLVTEINMLTMPKANDNGRYKIGESKQPQESEIDIEDDELPF